MSLFGDIEDAFTLEPPGTHDAAAAALSQQTDNLDSSPSTDQTGILDAITGGIDGGSDEGTQEVAQVGGALANTANEAVSTILDDTFKAIPLQVWLIVGIVIFLFFQYGGTGIAVKRLANKI